MMHRIQRLCVVCLVAPLAASLLSGCIVQRNSLEHAALHYAGMEEGRDFLVAGGVENSYFDIESPFQIGTIVDGSSEFALVRSDYEFERTGFELNFNRRMSRDWQFQALYRTSEADGSASASVAGGGSTSQGITYALPQDLGGGSTSTGLFLGSSYGLEGQIDFDHSWSYAGIGAIRTQEIDDQSQFFYGGSVFYEDVRTEYQGDLTATYSGAPYGDIGQSNYVKLYDRYYGIELRGGYQRYLGFAYASAAVEGFVDIANRNGSGLWDQSNYCGVCGPGNNFTQTLREDDDGAALSYGLRASLGVPITDSLGLQARYEWSTLGDVTHIMSPANPNEQPGGFYNEDAERHFFYVGLRAGF